ncbi:MAG TPA: hypothetical protein VGF94_11075 [Kofleriaceae bacterium]|jgi:uncharacterized CHY-type Zn-finger protein
MAIVLELSLECVTCGVVVPINGFTPELACWSCDRRTVMDAIAWNRLIDEPLRSSDPSGTEHVTTLATESGVFRRVFRIGSPTCNECHAPLDEHLLLDHASAAAQAVPCPKCAVPIALRHAPESFAGGRVAVIAGETAMHFGRQPVALACAHCGGNLTVDGSTRVVVCRYCSASQYLPDELFHQLRMVPVRSWAVFPVRDTARPAAPIATWWTARDAVADADGNIYVWGELVSLGGDPTERRVGALWSMAPDLTVRWSRDGLAFSTMGTRLAIAPTGQLLVFDDRSAHAVRCSDGETIVHFSGKPGEGGAIGVERARSIAFAADGGLIVCGCATDGHGTLARFDAQGQALPPTKATEHIAVAWAAAAAALAVPLGIDSALHLVGWDARHYFQLTNTWSCAVACHEADGRHAWTANGDTLPWQIVGRPGIDRDGRVYLLAQQLGGHAFIVYRLEPVRRTGLFHSRKPAWPAPETAWIGPLTPSDDYLGFTMTVAPDGSVIFIGGEGHLRRYAPDGRVQMVSPAAAASDAEAAR